MLARSRQVGMLENTRKLDISADDREGGDHKYSRHCGQYLCVDVGVR